ncbi:hypothetical protein CONCODRAFT_16817 [Conidiobolus coronatus NRRL 28638]|uniref:C2 domain-containing protein n=1 Tax=Conidiobolus coronatus (strain ATCC 28846 / CBS 209.66 / NRRL 28638) TaxID=796925 RepID=A0A137P9E2_CONC2|nr:hypothetical protein CONCODRAFT_16817 [Conidiobolus coronatus NRRL 28638]|eukprot:KXN71564.1 hypothetical protein CONCODRAFT_16817 [Conidiobolus coronatus NRRL 28638]
MTNQDKLLITVVSGKELHDKGGIFGSNDAYVVVSVGNRYNTTNIIEDAGHHAYWDNSFEFDASYSDEIRVDCMHGDGEDEGELIGRVVIPMDNIVKYGQVDQWYQLGKKGDFRGLIRLRIAYQKNFVQNQFSPAPQPNINGLNYQNYQNQSMYPPPPGGFANNFY